jgi:hypothetical protein
MRHRSFRLLALAAIAASFALAPTAQAANGDNLRTITSANPESCSLNTGLMFDGTNHIWTCWANNVINFTSPADGSFVRSVTVAGAGGLFAAAYDKKRNKLWICNNQQEVWLVDPADGSGSKQFDVDSGGCVDGLAYDGADDTIWSSGDAVCDVHHWKLDGTEIKAFDVCNPTALLGSNGNSGIATGGESLYLANNGGSQIYVAKKDFSSSELFATFPRRLEDMECDDKTFAPKDVIWSQDAYDRELNAYEIPEGSCSIGGASAPGALSGRVYDDANSNGARDGGEGGLQGVTVFVDKNDNGQPDAGEPSTTTAGDGTWSLADVEPGNHKVRATRASGYECTAPADCTYQTSVASGSTTSGLEFGQVAKTVDQKKCPDTRAVTFKFHRSARLRVVRYRVIIDGKKVADVKGKNLKGYTMPAPPQTDGTSVIIILKYNNGTQVKSTRFYNECGKTLPTFEVKRGKGGKN